jgi:xylulokinase
VFLCCKDTIRHRLTGDLLTEPVDACGTSLYDIQSRSWASELLALTGVRRDQLPDVVDPCDLAGTLRPEPASDLGLRAGIPVVVGAGDDVEVVGNGLIEPGLSLEHLGTTGSILACADVPVYDPSMAVELYPHVVEGLWVLGGSVTAAGSALAWAERALGSDAIREQEGEPPDTGRPLVFVPHLSGERCPAWEPHSRGAWVGLCADHSRDDLWRAVREGVVFSLRRVLDHIEGLVGPQVEIRVSGDEPLGSSWQRQRASIYRRPLATLRSGDPTALGAMIVAAVGVGMYGSVREAVRDLARVATRIEPDGELCESYEQLYGLYCAAEDALRPLMRAALSR